ncbi:MAG: hypothetical protein A2W90_08730 [Bacteroidetes bacterium GWF2_42_66]|nr:MAG: hypothetical protein A2W92_17465 [Bacteroidetes bacterium GWA2_42_15]OFX96756.1 MAG: hypothetical protein A2W89_21315 [Bacteroidetes bacterium GWE2_42_39]OFY45448.1 MAG: hypothetical protein A2W90_08730 [Bacteroidetes bacterium GWF2_42_66]HBL76168.1 hypothetical protein [Prolixibacteraceae bacterium]HCR90526.1 hypothetical protein [Prolixibacteraceae bacterium]
MTNISTRFLSIFILFSCVFLTGTGGHVSCKEAQKNQFTHATKNHTLSPYTGYTREHWLEITEQIIAGVLPYFDRETGMPHLNKNSYDYCNLKFKDSREENKRALERSMMAVIIYTTATGKDEVPGYNGSISAPYIKAITKGTDPGSPVFWGNPEPFDQVGSVFALGAYLNPVLFWDPLSEAQKRNILNYLQKQAFNKTYDNNHHFFHMVAAPLLEKYGYDANREHLAQMFERLLGWYRGDGWFIDGSNRGFDHYNLWGFQLYLHVLDKFDKKWHDQFGARIKQVSAHFFETLPFLFGRDGGPIPWGRSLSYRFADNAAIAWASLSGNCTLPPGQARRIASGELKYFWKHGCLDDNKLLTIGYWAANASVAEGYISPGDPYWATHGLACLLIPEDDPFWTAVEEPMPADGAGGKLAVPGAQFTVRVSPIDGEARLYPAGQPFKHDRKSWQIGTKYDQYAYSSYLGFCTVGEGGPAIGAGRTGFSVNGIDWVYNERAMPVKVEADHVESKYLLEPNGYDEIIKHNLIGNDGEIHVFWHNKPEPIYLFLGGYGIRVSHGEIPDEEKKPDGITLKFKEYYSIIRLVNCLEGVLDTELLDPSNGWAHTHLFGGKSAFPSWKSKNPVPPLTPLIIYTNGTRGRYPLPTKIKLLESPGLLRIQFEGKWFEINIPY